MLPSTRTYPVSVLFCEPNQLVGASSFRLSARVQAWRAGEKAKSGMAGARKPETSSAEVGSTSVATTKRENKKASMVGVQLARSTKLLEWKCVGQLENDCHSLCMEPRCEHDKCCCDVTSFGRTNSSTAAAVGGGIRHLPLSADHACSGPQTDTVQSHSILSTAMSTWFMRMAIANKGKQRLSL